MKIDKHTKIVFDIASFIVSVIRESGIPLPQDEPYEFSETLLEMLVDQCGEFVRKKYPNVTLVQIAEAMDIVMTHIKDGDPVDQILGFFPLERHDNGYHWIAAYRQELKPATIECEAVNGQTTH